MDAIEGYVEEQGLSNETPRIVCGDFNLEEVCLPICILATANNECTLLLCANIRSW